MTKKPSMSGKAAWAAGLALLAAAGTATGATAWPGEGRLQATLPGAPHAECWMKLSNAGPQANLTAHAAAGLSGRYELDVTQEFGSRSLEMTQDGAFTAPRYRSVRLTRMMVGNLMPSTGYRVGGGADVVIHAPDMTDREAGLAGELRVYDERGRLICRTRKIGGLLRH